MTAGALLLAAALAVLPAAPVGPHEWSVEMLDGTPAATATLFTDVVISPGRSFSSGYLIPHSADITGPLEISAEPLSAPNDLESSLSFAFGVNGVAGPTASLTDLLRDGRSVEVTDALPAGTPRLDITASMDSAPTTQAKLQQVVFRFVLTVSDQTIVIPVTPPSALAATGVDPPIRTILLVVAAIVGGGLALLVSRRRRGRREAASAAPPASPGRPAR
jgi:hypothetical protein